EEFVRRKTRDARQGGKGVGFCYCDDVVRIGIDTKFPVIKILHNERIAQFGEASGAVDVVGKIRPVLQAEPVTPGRNARSWHTRVIYFRILVLDVISLDLGPAVVVLSIFDSGIKANGHTTPPPIIEPKPAFDIVGDRERDLGEDRWSP